MLAKLKLSHGRVKRRLFSVLGYAEPATEKVERILEIKGLFVYFVVGKNNFKIVLRLDRTQALALNQAYGLPLDYRHFLVKI